MGVRKLVLPFGLFLLLIGSCKKSPVKPPDIKPPPAAVTLNAATINNLLLGDNSGINSRPVIKFTFSQPIQQKSIASGITLSDPNGGALSFSATLSNGDSVVTLQPTQLNYLTRYLVSVGNSLESKDGGKLTTPMSKVFATGIDSFRKFPAIPDSELLTKVQQQTFKYFWDFAHPTSGLARERSNGDNNLVTSGGSGFGIMALIVGIERGFITRTEGGMRLQKIVSFLKDKAQVFHGAYPHWLHGETGAVIPFSANDNGADLVETSFLIQGLLTARQYFSTETNLVNDINSICNRVEWNWFTQSQNVLYWHWSPDKAWTMNLKIQGWNECLITYVLAAASQNYSVSKAVYDAGWARNGSQKNGKTFYNYVLPLGSDFGGPLFFEHYSFLGLQPATLSDTYANYADQTKNHTLINYNYCKNNPNQWYGYSDSVWGLTASDIRNGYTASSPTNDRGFIAPTGALASFPYAPNEAMAALKFYYYVLGDKLFGTYGFKDAFTLDVLKNNGPWFAESYLAIDQGPIVVMIENYRTGLLWNLFMSAPEVRAGLTKLGFSGF